MPGRGPGPYFSGLEGGGGQEGGFQAPVGMPSSLRRCQRVQRAWGCLIISVIQRMCRKKFESSSIPFSLLFCFQGKACGMGWTSTLRTLLTTLRPLCGSLVVGINALTTDLRGLRALSCLLVAPSRALLLIQITSPAAGRGGSGWPPSLRVPQPSHEWPAGCAYCVSGQILYKGAG